MTRTDDITRQARQAMPGHDITVQRYWDGYEIQADAENSHLYISTGPGPDRNGRRSALAEILGIIREDQ